MGFGEFLRNIVVTQQNTVTGEKLVETIVTGPGAFPETDGVVTSSEFRGMLGVPAAWRATQLITDVLGGVPWHAHDELPDGTHVKRTPTPRLLEQPAGFDSRVTTYSSWGMDLIWHGNAIGIVWTRDAYGEPDIVVPVAAEYAFVKYVNEADNIPTFRPGEIVYLIGDVAYKPDDIVHIKGICRPGALRGMGVLEYHLKTLALDIELRKQAGASSGAGVPLGVLRNEDPDMTAADAEEISAMWHAKQAQRKVAVLNSALTFESLAWNPSEAQLLEARKFGHNEIALIFGVDPEWLGASQSSRTYQNIEQSGIELIRRSSLAGHLARFEAELSRHLRPGTRARANLDSVQRADTLARYQGYSLALSSEFLTDDEVRALENRPPLTPAQREQMKAKKPEPPKLSPPSADMKKEGEK